MPSAEVLAAAQQKIAERDRCKTDKMYLAGVLGYDGFQPEVHQDLFDCLLQIKPNVSLFEQDDHKDRMILWPRSHYKTTAIVVEIIQLILNFPDIAILLMQGTVKLTKGLLGEIKSHFIGEAHNSRLTELFPEFCADKMGTKESFTVPARTKKNRKEATVTVASPRTTKASQHYDVGFFDDLVNDQNFRNPELVQKAIDDFNLYTPLVESGLGYKYVTGTRYAFGDLYEWILTENIATNSWIISLKQCWRLVDGIKVPLFPEKKINGKVIGFTIARLEQIQHNDPAMFCCQYLNEPAQTNRQSFTEEMMSSTLRDSKHKEYPDYAHTVLFVDLNASDEYYSDDGVVLAGRADVLGRSWVVDCCGSSHGSNNSMDAVSRMVDSVIRMTVAHRPYKVLVEGTGAGKVFIELVKTRASLHHVYVPIEELKVDGTKGAKNIRISSLVGEIQNKRLFFMIGIPIWSRIVKQFTDWVPGRKSNSKYHDDHPDTVALMVRYFQTNTIQRQMPRLTDHPMFAKDTSNQILIDNGIDPNSPQRSDELGSFFCC